MAVRQSASAGRQTNSTGLERSTKRSAKSLDSIVRIMNIEKDKQQRHIKAVNNYKNIS